VVWHAGIWNDLLCIFLLNRVGVISLSAASIFTNPFDILYSRISLAVFLLSSNDVHCSCPIISVTDEVLWYRFFTYLAALRWTISIWCLLFCWYGSQVVQAYSRVGLTSDCYAFSFRFELLMLRFLFKKLKVLFAFLQMLVMCSLHFISDVIDTPRYLADWTCSSWWPWRI
jgi:hypothetical protein